MTPIPLPPDDQPPELPTVLDIRLRRQLELSTSTLFFNACDGSTQSLLMACAWRMEIADVLMLVIYCPDAMTNWRVLNRIAAIAEVLFQFSSLAKIRVHPPQGTGSPFDMRVDERSEFRDGQRPV